MKRKFVFLYLNTGGGHKSSAKVMKQILLKRYPDVEVSVINAFDEKNYLGKAVFEKVYHIALNFCPGLYSLFYRIGKPWFQKLVIMFTDPRTSTYLTKVFIQEEATDVVVFHFAIENAVKLAIKRSGRKINMTMIVTDPYTAHSSWFLDAKADYLVFSEQVRKFAIDDCHVSPNSIKVVPFILDPRYKVKVSEIQIAKLKEKYGLKQEKHTVLLTGGGEGLPNMIAIVTDFIKRNVPFSVVAVCGRDVTAQKYLEVLANSQNKVDIKVFGFVTFMNELVQLCDCAVIKAGPASLMEVLSSCKPVIICHFIYGQELGNVQFAVDNKVGTFIRKPKKITEAVEKLLSDENKLSRLKKRFLSLPIDVDSTKIADILYKKNN